MAPSHRTSYTVSYDSESHWSVITQMWGSKWSDVLPYCVFNVCLMLLLEYLDKRYAGRYSIETSQEGHSLVTLVVAFLLVSRVNIGLSRYNVARDHLGAMYRESRELIQGACVFSNHTTDQKAATWRNQVALRSMLLLRLAMAVIDFPCSGVAAWEVPELQSDAAKEIHADLMGSIFVGGSSAVRYGHGAGPRSEWEETMRVPIRMAYLLRKTVHSQSKVLSKEIALSQENAMLASINGFMGGYYGIRKFITTPTPFPLIQMARLLLFLYLFTVPFILLSDNSSEFAHCFAVFLMTYGFMGLEVVAIELDNPFGDDDNDFDNMALAETAFEDTYLTILDVDGPVWADKLRVAMEPLRATNEHALSVEQSWLLDPIV